MRPTGWRAEAADDGREAPLVRRRALLGWPAALACGPALTGCGAPDFVTVGATSPAPDPSPSAEEIEPVTPPEDLMREHGVLKRILLIYREGIRRIEGGQPVPAQALHAGAYLIRTFIEEYHEHLEEKYVFPALVKAGKLTGTVQILIQQHDRGRTLTARILNATGTTPAPTPSARARGALVADMAAFIRMYEPHEAREDTVVFPALREVVTLRQFAEMGEIFEDEEHRRFGTAGFTGIVNQVADIEKSLGIYDLAQFTPRT
ncbi:hemerythrin domain-containing protein [Acrocarpospora catenulata]|uniref:hemerythrin domain-containing protein n=1 Tax=Acrocarpospora catenulata TaxID=2836182 RepID=UPI001BD9D7BB|nr:hemerythrin domain-containing protein [Acrocarpospora catenulata]